MTEQIVGWSALAVSLVFVVIALAITAKERLGLTRTIMLAVARSLGQMMLVGFALVPIVNPKTPLVWSWLWVVVIIFFAALTATRRTPNIQGMFGIALFAMVTVGLCGLAIVFGLGVFELQGRTLVPVAGMLIGNSMNSAVVASQRVSESVSNQRTEIEAGLALGMTVKMASRRFIRSALRTAITPQVETTAALGIIFLPGTMTGLILAGVAPFAAVRTQLVLMYVILAGVVIAASISGLGTLARLTTSDNRIMTVARTN
ncbi:MAG: iron export ABC transporter permease subunit FetB [Microthrixaceae bacterium]